jgi:hypothetical protein
LLCTRIRRPIFGLVFNHSADQNLRYDNVVDFGKMNAQQPAYARFAVLEFLNQSLSGMAGL